MTLERMFKVHVADRLAVAVGLAPQDRPARRMVSLGLVAVVLAAAVGVMVLYAGVRELTRPGVSQDNATSAPRELRHLAPAAGPDKLMSIEEMRRRAGQN